MKRKNRDEYVGKTYGELTVLHCDYKYYTGKGGEQRGFPFAKCACSCGAFKEVLLGHLTRGSISSCGCKTLESYASHAKLRRKYNTDELVGKRFNRLLVLSEHTTTKVRKVICACDCGNFSLSVLEAVVTGRHKSCGCTWAEARGVQPHTTEEFIDDALNVHGPQYSYSQTVYKSNHEKVDITCLVEGHGVFSQTPANHKNGVGCPKCRRAGFNRNLPGKLYILVADGMVKVGITNTTSALRCRMISWSAKIAFSVYKEYEFNDGGACQDLESAMLSELRRDYDNPRGNFDGYTEVFCGVDATHVDNRINDLMRHNCDN